MYNVTLEGPRFDSFKAMKGCLAETPIPGRDHPWSRALRPLKIRSRLSIVGSLFLFRKTLPSDAPSIPDYISKMSVPSPPAPLDFHRFLRREVRAMFPVGWDRGYGKRIDTATLSVSSCLESSRKDGGVRALAESFDRAAFCGELLELYNPKRYAVSRAKLALALCDGKKRLVTINSKDMAALMPLHRTLYDFISRKDWCLRGEAVSDCFSDFLQVPGETFTSGDYESATDNLNQSVQTSILHTVLDRCRYVPFGVRRSALDSLSCDVFGDGFEFRALRGQLMGNALSFPLLCLVNYLIFKYFIRRDVPVRINGDDIVFRSTPAELARWKEGVRSCGLTLSAGKTIVANRIFSLNSTFFVSSPSKVRMAPVVRSTVLFKKLDDLSSLKGRIDSFRFFDSVKRSYLTSLVLRKFSSSIWYTQRSIRRGLEIYASDRALRLSNLYDRERFYLDLPAVSDPHLPVGVSAYYKSRIPTGWKRVPGTRQDPEFTKEMIDLCWDPIASDVKTVDNHAGTFKMLDFPLGKSMRLLGFKRVALFRRWRLRKPLPRPAVSGKKVWVREVPPGAQYCQFVPAC